MERAIGVFDSGVGGLTVLNSIRTLLPNENIIYIGDKQETLFIGGLLSAADIFMFLCIYRKYETDPGSQ